MKNTLSIMRNVILATIMLISTGWLISCQEDDLEQSKTAIENVKMAAGDVVSLTNPGFESSWTGWNDSDPSAISGDANSGSKSAKITGSGGKAEQTVSVSPNTNYILSAYIQDKGTIGVIAGSNDYNDGGDFNDWTQVSVSFNSGSNSSITIYGKYNGGTGRFDDFSLIEDSGSGGSGSGGENGKLSVSSVSASANDGNVPSNTLDGNLGTRWSANGSGQYITYDLGSIKSVSSMKIAWYKGDQRNSYFKIRAGNTTSTMSDVFNASTSGSSGSTTSLETYSFDAVNARYVRITGFGNSSNSWNSVTEAEIWGSSGNGGGDTTPPGSVNNLSATAGNSQVSLSWTNPSDSDFDYVSISYNGSNTTSTSSSKTITGLTNGTSFTFTVIAYDDSGNASSSKSVSATPQGSGGGSANVPSDLMANCNQWKITYPDGSEDKTLCGEGNNEYYFVSDNQDAIVFKVPIRSNNGSTPNSSYIRSELRERKEDGSSDIYWTTTGQHVVYSKQAITHLPINKNHLVATQIHGNKSDGIDDAMVLRLEGSHLFLSFNGGKLRSDLTIKTDYVLGTQHEVIFEIINGKHYCYYSEDGNLSNAYNSGNASSYLVKDGSNNHVMDINYDQTYFKIGNYTQSNPDKEGSDTDDPNNYGEVYVYDFWVLHN
ncbi:polysaccharide lyase family 7 protein [Reichenbachiella sp.]|uniref:polysaccharide lyase family 7 protein n=1 Tax=Reichenbachiella sp. TaxID=2184521 RepID=UPI003BB032D4